MENRQLKSFKDLSVWQKAVDLAAFVYSITEKFPRAELYGITNQMRRSAVSVSSNIAEGFKRNHTKEKLQFYNVAYGSIAELESQIEVSYKLNFLNNEDYQKLNLAVVEIGKMTDGLIKSVNTNFPKSYILNPIFFFIFLTSIFYILNPFPPLTAQTARAETVLEFASHPQEYPGPTDFSVTLSVSTDEPLNAYDITIRYPEELVRVRSVNTARSVIDLWQTIPKAKDGIITVTGGSRTPFSGKNGELLTINFYAIKPGEGMLEFEKAEVYIADGRGTPAEIRTNASPISIALVGLETQSPAPGFELRPALPKDTNPPEIRFLEVSENPGLPGENLLVFDITDSGSGLKSIFARSKKWISWGPWYQTKNPHPLPAGAWKAELAVEDNAGNFASRTLVLRKTLYLKAAFGGSAALAAIIAAIAAAFIIKRRRPAAI